MKTTAVNEAKGKNVDVNVDGNKIPEISNTEVKKLQDEKSQGTTILNAELNAQKGGDEPRDSKTYFYSNEPRIYAFITPKIKDAIKVGFTTQPVHKRIQQWEDIYKDVECLGDWPAHAFFKEIGKQAEEYYFWDKDVHKKIIAKGFINIDRTEFNKRFKMYCDETNTDPTITIHYSKEFFNKYNNADDKPELANAVIGEIIAGMIKLVETGKEDFDLYKIFVNPETGEKSTGGKEKLVKFPGSIKTYKINGMKQGVVDNAIASIDDGKKNLLMGAVMRFGKTHTAYEIVKALSKNHNNKGLKIFVTSAKADVRAAWRDDINHVNFEKSGDKNNFVFVEFDDVDKKTGKVTYDISSWCYNNNSVSTYHGFDPENEDNMKLFGLTPKPKDGGANWNFIESMVKDGRIVIIFTTFQDLTSVNRKRITESEEDDSNKEEFTIKAKFNDVRKLKYDMMIIDETHYGSTGKLFSKVIKRTNDTNDDQYDGDEQYKEDEKFEKKLNAICNVDHDVTLQVSGTPYKLLSSKQLRKENAAIISTISYSDMMEEKEKWDKENLKKPVFDSDSDEDRKKKEENPGYFREPSSHNPLAGLPTLHKFGLQLTKEASKRLKREGADVSINPLFDTENGKLKYPKEIAGVLRAMFGDDKEDGLSFLDDKVMREKNICKHTIVVLPSVESCHLVKKLMNDEHISRRDIIVVVKNNKEVNRDGEKVKPYTSSDYDKLYGGELTNLNRHLAENDNSHKKTLILTVSRLLTGTTMPLVDSMIFMKDCDSPQDYDQAIYRLCSKREETVIKKGSTEEMKQYGKNDVYLIDFNIDNLINMTIESEKAHARLMGEKHVNNENIFAKSIKYSPIMIENLDGAMGEMKELTVQDGMKRWTDYNEKRNITESIKDILSSYIFKLLTNNELGELTNELNKYKQVDNSNTDETSDGDNNGGFLDGKTPGKSLKEYADAENKAKKAKKEKDEKKQNEINRQKILEIINKLAYVNVCIDEPCESFDDLCDYLEKDKTLCELFDIPFDVIKKLNEIANEDYPILKEKLDNIIKQIDQRFDICKESKDKLNSMEILLKGLSGMGKLAKSEVETPQSVVKKMVDKMTGDEKNILIVNDKYGEFLIGILKKFGKKWKLFDNDTKDDKKSDISITIVPSSEKTRNIIRKVVETLGLKRYIYISDITADTKASKNFLNTDI